MYCACFIKQNNKPEEDRMLRIMKNQKGFTLIEILVVVIIVAILAPLPFPVTCVTGKITFNRSSNSNPCNQNAFDVYVQTNGTSEGYTVDLAEKDAAWVNPPLNTVLRSGRQPPKVHSHFLLQISLQVRKTSLVRYRRNQIPWLRR